MNPQKLLLFGFTLPSHTSTKLELGTLAFERNLLGPKTFSYAKRNKKILYKPRHFWRKVLQQLISLVNLRFIPSKASVRAAL